MAAIGVRRCLVDACPGVSDRIELRDAEPGEAMLLLNDTHQPAGSPYRASHAIDVREAARRCCDAVDCVPDVLSRRWISLRSFDAADLMIAAEPATGRAPGGAIESMLPRSGVDDLYAHHARRGCYAARIDHV